MEHLALEIFDIGSGATGSSFAYMEPDAAITITDTSEVFAKGDLWSYSFRLDTRANAHIFGSSGDIHGSRLHEQIDRRRARLWAEGVPLKLGYLRLAGEADVDEDGFVDVKFESGMKTFDDMVEGAKASQVPLMGDVEIGMAHWRKRWTTFAVKMEASSTTTLKAEDGGLNVTFSGQVLSTKAAEQGDAKEKIFFECDGEKDGYSVQEYPRLVYPEGSFQSTGSDGEWTPGPLVNTDEPYSESGDGTPTHPYCNVALCYQKYGYDRKDTFGTVRQDYSAEPEAQRGYEYMPADRVNPAPNFYVIYWLRCLMKHLGIYVEENQMLGVEDLRRLFFVNTKCAYEEPDKLRTLEESEVKKRYGRYRASDSRLTPEYILPERNINIEESGLKVTGFDSDATYADKFREAGIRIKITEVEDWNVGKDTYRSNNNYYHRAYATSECFPDVDISEAVSAVKSGFGVRLLFSDDYRRVRIVLLRNIFRSRDVQEVDCDITNRWKTENSTRGFRMTYGDIDDTHYYYKGFADKLPHKKELWQDTSDKHDYSKWKLDAEYGQIIKRVSAFDKTCYVTPETGNAWGIKVDKDAKRYDEKHPAVFEYAAFMDAEDGDCTGEEETIETVTCNFRPAIMNDLNMEAEREGRQEQRFALFVDEKMQPRRVQFDDKSDYNNPAKIYDVDELYSEESPARMMMADGIVKPGEFAIRSDVYVDQSLLQRAGENLQAELKFLWLGQVLTNLQIEGHVNEGYRLYLQDNYEPNDTGVCPIETHDWGLTLGIMRGSGGDAYVMYEGDPDDHEGNDTWERKPGSSVTSHPDTCDNYGNLWDYNGIAPESGDTENRISLKLRAEKLNPYFDPKQPESDTNRRYLEITDKDLRQRGLIDQFYKEYSYWVRNARIANIEARMELAQLLAIDKTKRVKVGDVTGFIRKMQYTISNRTGLGLVTMEIMYI